MNKTITITLANEDWLAVAQFLSCKIGETVNPMPVINLLQALSVAEKGFIDEITNRKGGGEG